MAIVDGEEMKRGDLGGGRSGTTADAIAGEGHEGRNNCNSVLHLFSPSNHRRKSPGHSLVIIPSDALFRRWRGGEWLRRHDIGLAGAGGATAEKEGGGGGRSG